MPLRSKHIAAQALSRVPASKRGEILVMKRLGMIDNQSGPTESAQRDYNSMFVDKLNPSHEDAFKELLLGAEPPVRPTRRRATHA